MKVYEKLLLENKAWVKETMHNNPKYFDQLSKSQKPHTLWIGSTDSRVVASIILNRELGDVVIHQNPGNLVHADDANVISTVCHAVDNLHVRHIVVCGHTNCDFVRMGMKSDSPEIMQKWLHPIHELYEQHRSEIDSIGDKAAQVDKLAEINVKAQVDNLAKLDFVKAYRETGHDLWLHGWMFDLKTGLINDIYSV